MARYNPPHKVTTLEVPIKALILRADPDFEAAKRSQTSYETTGRKFTENPATSGPYSTKPNVR